MHTLKRLSLAASVTLALGAAAAWPTLAEEQHHGGGGGGGASHGGGAVRPTAPRPNNMPPRGTFAPPNRAGTPNNFGGHPGQQNGNFNRNQPNNFGRGNQGQHNVNNNGAARQNYAGRHNYHDFRGHDFAHFSPAERATWSHGGWHHEWHNGHYGWWWGVGGLWYFYPAPIYPYPEYVATDVYEPPVADEGPGPDDQQPTAGYAPGYWYYCSASSMYYPYAQTCAVPWTPVTPSPQPGQVMNQNPSQDQGGYSNDGPSADQ